MFSEKLTMKISFQIFFVNVFIFLNIFVRNETNFNFLRVDQQTQKKSQT